MPLDEITEIIKFLPDSLTTDRGDTFDMTWGREKTKVENDPPGGVISFVGENETQGTRWEDQEDGTQNQQDTFTFDTSQDVYQVTERDIASVNSVDDASGDSYVEDTDFEIHSTADYTTDDAIKWLDGGSSPDDGEDFTVDYEHFVFFDRHSKKGDLVVQIAILAESIEIGTNYYDKLQLAKVLASALEEYFMDNRGARLKSLGNSNYAMKIRGADTFGTPVPAEGDTLGIFPVNVGFGLIKKSVEDDPEKRIGAVETDLSSDIE